MKKLLTFVLVLALVGFAMTGCAQPKQESETSEGATTSETEASVDTTEEETDMTTETTGHMKIGIVANSATVFYNNVDSAIVDTLEPLGYSYVRAVSDFDVEKELSAVEDILLQGVDAMFISISDAAGSAEAISRCNDAGVPVFCADSQPVSTDIDYVTCVMSNNVEAGKMVMEYICEQLNYEGRIAVIDGPQVTCVLDRMQGYREVDEKYDGIEIVSTTMVSEHSLQGNITTMEDIIQSDPEIDAILGYCAYTVMASETALTNLNRLDILVGGVDGLEEECAIIDKGIVTAATSGQNPYAMGEMLADSFLQYMDDPDAEIEQFQYTPLILLTPGTAVDNCGIKTSTVRPNL